MRKLLVILIVVLFSPWNPVKAGCDIDLDIFAFRGDYSDLIDGYCVEGYWTPGLITDVTYRLQQPMYFTTRALYQVKGLIDETASIRNLNMDGVEGYISLLSPSVLGWTVWIRPVGETIWTPTRNVDGVDPAHYYYHAVTLASGLELSYELAERFDNINWVNDDGTRYRQFEVCLSADAPTVECVGAPIDYTEWFLSVVKYY